MATKKPAKKSATLAKAAPPKTIIDLTAATFESIVLKGADLVIVDFHATWCAPCKVIAPVLADIADSYKGLLVTKLDIDKAPTIADKYKVQTVPTLLFFRGGKQVAKIEGVSPRIRGELETLLRKHL